jgi:hypothetical protein
LESKSAVVTSDESPTADCTHSFDVTRRGATEDWSREEEGTTSIGDDCAVDGITAVAV